MSRLERLLNLTAALLTAPRPLTAAELHERVPGYPSRDEGGDAFRRAFERDKDALRDMGIPVTRREVEGVMPAVEGYLIPRKDYELRDPELAPDELAAIHLATAAVQLEGLPGTGGIWKLGGTTTKVAERGAVAALPSSPQLAVLFEAVAQRRNVTFPYRRGSGGERASARSVQPWRLSFARGHWYLDGWDREREAERRFRVDRIDGPVSAGEPGDFERPAILPTTASPPWELGEEAPVRATVRIDRDQAGWAVEHVGPDATVTETEDGAVNLTLTVTNRDAFRSFVLGFLDHAEVLAPPDLRAEMTSWLRALTGRSRRGAVRR